MIANLVILMIIVIIMIVIVSYIYLIYWKSEKHPLLTDNLKSRVASASKNI